MASGCRVVWRAAIPLVGALLVGAVAAQTGWAASRGERLQAVVDHLAADVYLGANLLGHEQAFHVPGATLSVSIPGRRPRTFVTGLADVVGRRVMRRGMTQPIGSGTKPMVAAAILSLVERRRFALDDRLTQVAAANRRDGGVLAALVRRYAGRLRGVTLRSLLNMTSGLASYDDTAAFGAAFATAPLAPRSLAELAEYGLAQPPQFRPNQRDRTIYSNTNYALLGMVLEAVTGRPVAAILHDVFVRAGMRHTSYPSAGGALAQPVLGYQPVYPPGTELPPVLQPFASAPTVYRRFAPHAVLTVSRRATAEGPTTPLAPAGPVQRRRYGRPSLYGLQDIGGRYSLLGVAGTAGAVTSDAEDLARFWRKLFDGRLLNPDLLRELKRSVPAPPNAPGVRYFYGLGVQRQDVSPGAFWPGSPRLRIWMKLGDTFGYTSASYYLEGEPFDGVVVTNTTSLFPSPVGDLGVLRATLRAIRPHRATGGNWRSRRHCSDAWNASSGAGERLAARARRKH
jgi:CubicO group peptidase (beta-lactamase class C family)